MDTKKAVVIGANGGIGSALIVNLEKAGYEIIPVDLEARISCDLTDFDQINRAISAIKNEAEKIDLLVNSAGVSLYKNLIDATDQDLHTAFMVNVIAPAIFIRELSPLMVHEKSLVLNIGSGMGIMPTKGRSLYCSSKFAFRGLSLSLSEEYKDRNPRFCLITLGSTMTSFGTMTVEEKKRASEEGKAYFPVEWVADTLSEIIEDENRDDEITLFPSEYGFGQWDESV